MKLDEDGMMIILSSPSGAGKTTLTKLISEKKNTIFQYHIPPENQDRARLMKKIIFLFKNKNLTN